MILSAHDIRQMGLLVAKMTDAEQTAKGPDLCNELIRALYGSPPEVLADVWHDLCNTTIPGARLTDEEKSNHGVKMFFLAHYMLWTYPRNARLIEIHFGPIAEKLTRGDPLWKWIRKIESLLPEKIKWLPRLDDPNCEAFIVTIDGVDCRTWESRRHPTFNIDRRLYSKKFAHAALKYEIAVAIFEDKIVWVNGPFRGGKHDLSIFREDGLMDKIQDGKMGITDRGYRTSVAAEADKLAFKREEDPPDLKKIKGRSTCRHETVNSRIKQFCAASETFRHGKDKQEAAFKAICVVVQYQIDHGAYLYQV